MIGQKKWWLLAASAVVFAGCGGNGGGGGIVPPPGGGRSRPTISLSSTGQVQTVFLSGSDRRAVGSQIAEISNVRFQNSASDYVPGPDQNTNKQIRVQLDGYTMNQSWFAVPFNVSSAISYIEYPMEIAKMYRVATGGSLVQLTPNNQIAYTPPEPFDIKLRVFPGRVSSVSLRLNDAILNYSSTTNSVVFNSDLFLASNYDPILSAIGSSFSDYVSFDLSAMAAGNRPTLSNSTAADRVYYSGDGLAISAGLGDTSTFELLKPVSVLNGKVSVGPVIGPGGQQVTGSNLFILDDEDPSATKVTSIVGTWRPFNEVLGLTDNVTAVAFPSSRETDDPTDREEQQFVIFSTNGSGNITAMWQGSVFYNTSGDPNRGTFRLFPVDTVDDAIPSDQITGTVSNLTFKNGVVMGGDWDVTSAAPGSWSFPLLGGFAVYRK